MLGANEEQKKEKGRFGWSKIRVIEKGKTRSGRQRPAVEINKIT